MCFSSGGSPDPAPTANAKQPERAAAPAAAPASSSSSDAVQKPGSRGSRDAQGRTTGGSRRTAIGKGKGLTGTVLTKGPVLGTTGETGKVSGKTLLGA
jgi:hypothetical protein